ncbi:hypothetical protein VXJ16_004257 [Vibrio vulnificus]|nr:hypothetical protein [Vibrio vulnificus]
MATREKRQASGTLELSYEWEESSSGHAEDTYFTTLRGEGLEVKMVEHESHQNAFKSASSTTKQYSISVKELIELIKTHGKLVK